jgi:hypothetical protein
VNCVRGNIHLYSLQGHLKQTMQMDTKGEGLLETEDVLIFYDIVNLFK